jgi:hypothetical protein
MHEYPVSTHIHDTRAGARVNFSYRARHPPAPISAILTRLHQQQIVQHGKRVADDGTRYSLRRKHSGQYW